MFDLAGRTGSRCLAKLSSRSMFLRSNVPGTLRIPIVQIRSGETRTDLRAMLPGPRLLRLLGDLWMVEYWVSRLGGSSGCTATCGDCSPGGD